MPVVQTFLSPLSHWQYASDSEFCRHLCDSFQEKFQMFAASTCCFVSFFSFFYQQVKLSLKHLQRLDFCHFSFTYDQLRYNKTRSC